MRKTWILVANGWRAQIFSCPEAGRPWDPVITLDHPASRSRNLDIAGDRFGRVQHRSRNGRRSAMQPASMPKEVEKKTFALQIAHILEKHASQSMFDDLILVAPPHFLGLLRQVLSSEVLKRVATSINKDLTASRPVELPRRLAANM